MKDKRPSWYRSIFFFGEGSNNGTPGVVSSYGKSRKPLLIGDLSMSSAIGDIEGVKLGKKKNKIEIRHNARCRARSNDAETSGRGERMEEQESSKVYT